MVILANAVSFIGCILMVLTGFVKKKENILWVQCVQFVFMGIAHLMLGATGGLVCCLVSIVRNIAFTKLSSTFAMKVCFIFVQVVLTFLAGSFAWIELLPIMAAVIFTWFLDLKNPVHFKIMLIFAQLMWVFYDFYYGNFSAGVFDVLTIGSNLAGIWMLLK